MPPAAPTAPAGGRSDRLPPYSEEAEFTDIDELVLRGRVIGVELIRVGGWSGTTT